MIDRLLSDRLRANPRRAVYFCSAVANLDRALRAEGTRLIVRRGQRAQALRSLARAAGAGTVVAARSYDALGIAAERRVQSALEEAGLRALFVHDAPVLPPEEGVAARALVPYITRWMRELPPDPEPPTHFAGTLEVPTEALPEPGEFGAPSQSAEADEASVLRRFTAFLEGPAFAYGVARNTPSLDTSHLCAPLSFGVVAARTVVRAVCRRLTDPFLLVEEAASLRIFLRALATRDFFLQLGWNTDGLDEEPLQPKMRRFPFAERHPALDAWREGTTGFPLVDAGIRQLRATGWMHPHVRAVAASFLCFDLGVDWRIGRDEWERHLTEDDAALAIGNWQWIAGVGADLAAYPRIYNPLKQARRFDPSGVYIRRWIPELAASPDAALVALTPERQSAQLRLPLFDGRYPAPVVDHGVAARDFLQRYRAFVDATKSTSPLFARPNP